ncbi:MAG: hypothetical protein H6604_09400 [Flavobacteriales bacterium]|nr:hypothetical protein [Flavobacteriales bacterium]
MKFTNYFLHTREREDRKNIKMEWIEFTFYHPDYQLIQDDGRIRKWTLIKEINKYLRVVVLEDEQTIHNAFFDRSFNPLNFKS